MHTGVPGSLNKIVSLVWGDKKQFLLQEMLGFLIYLHIGYLI